MVKTGQTRSEHLCSELIWSVFVWWARGEASLTTQMRNAQHFEFLLLIILSYYTEIPAEIQGQRSGISVDNPPFFCKSIDLSALFVYTNMVIVSV